RRPGRARRPTAFRGWRARGAGGARGAAGAPARRAAVDEPPRVLHCPPLDDHPVFTPVRRPMKTSPPIIYTWTDEAPALATHALLPVIRAFAGATGVPVETRDISLAGRVLAAFPDRLGDRPASDDLAELGRLVQTPEANVIKLPNISASVPQLKAVVKELQAKGYALPDYPDEPKTEEEREVRARYDRVKGS